MKTRFLRHLILLFLSVTQLSLTFSDDAPRVRVVYNIDGAPFAWDDHGTPFGFEPTIAEYCLNKLGLKVTSLFLPWARAQKMIEAGEADLMITTPTDDRFCYGIFGKGKVILTKSSLFTSKDNRELIKKAKQFRDLGDLKPFTLVDYMGNGWTLKYLPVGDGFHVINVFNSDRIPEVLITKKADFCLISSIAMQWVQSTTGTRGSLVEIPVDLPHTRFHYVFIVSRKSPWVSKGLVKGLDAALGEMKKSGE